MRDIKPDVTVILDVDPNIALARTTKRNHQETRYEKFAMEFHQRVRQGFLEIAENNPERCIVIDATQPIKKILKTHAKA